MDVRLLLDPAVVALVVGEFEADINLEMCIIIVGTYATAFRVSVARRLRQLQSRKCADRVAVARCT